MNTDHNEEGYGLHLTIQRGDPYGYIVESYTTHAITD